MIKNKQKTQALAGAIITITISVIVTSALLYAIYEPIRYEKRALIFHANTLQNLDLNGETIELVGMDREYYIDIKNLYDQLIINEYIVSWYYFDNNESSSINVLRTLKLESRRSEQLIVFFASHAGMNSQSNEFNHRLDQRYSSIDIMNALDKDTKTYIFSAGCSTGYFVGNYQIPKNWIITSSVDKDDDICNCTFYIDVNVSNDHVWYVDDAVVNWASIKALVFAMKNNDMIEDIYSAQLVYLEEHYLGSYYFSLNNMPQIWDGDITTTWRI